MLYPIYLCLLRGQLLLMESSSHYVPQLAALVMDYKKHSNGKPIRLKAVAVNLSLLTSCFQLYVTYYLQHFCNLHFSFKDFQHLFCFSLFLQLGNPLLDWEISIDNTEFLWSHGVISDEVLTLRKTVCSRPRVAKELLHRNLPKECTEVTLKQNV